MRVKLITFWEVLTLVTLWTIFSTVVGGLAGYTIGTLRPDYYKQVFGQGRWQFDPIDVGVGLGISEGLAAGFLAVTVILLPILAYSYSSRGLVGRFLSRPRRLLTIFTASWVFRLAIVGTSFAIFYTFLQIVVSFLWVPPHLAAEKVSWAVSDWSLRLVVFTVIGAAIGVCARLIASFLPRRKQAATTPPSPHG
jgi:hypothetical protein